MVGICRARHHVATNPAQDERMHEEAHSALFPSFSACYVLIGVGGSGLVRTLNLWVEGSSPSSAGCARQASSQRCASSFAATLAD